MDEAFDSLAGTADGFAQGFTTKANEPDGLSDQHARWLEQVRKIPSEIAAECGVVTLNGNLAYEFRDRKGKLLYRKSRIEDSNGSKRFVRDRSGVPSVLWGLDKYAPECADTITICEGENDRLALIAVGAVNVFSVPDGAQMPAPGEGDIDPLKDKAFAWLWDGDRLLPELRNAKKFILAVDSDDKGITLREELAVRLGRDLCYFVRYPQGCKDANDVLMREGEDALMNVLADARPIIPDELVRIGDLPEMPIRPSYSTGWGPDGANGLDSMLTIRPPELMVVTGTPNAGKSQFVLPMLARMQLLHGLKSAFLQFEDTEERLVADLTRFAVKHGVVKYSSEAHKWLDQWLFIVKPDESAEDVNKDRDLDWLKRTIHQAATRHNCKFVCIDPWNECEHMWEKNETQASYLNRAIKQIKALARRYNICIIIIAHPIVSSGRSHTSIDQWSLYDIDGGAVWNNKADHGIVLARVDSDATLSGDKRDVLVKVSKSKDWERMGRPGTARMRFIRESGDYEFVGFEN